MKGQRFNLTLIVTLAVVALAAFQCDRAPISPKLEDPIGADGLLKLDMRLPKALAQAVDRVIVIAEHPLMKPVRGELEVKGARATGSLEVPPGEGWVVTVEAYIGNLISWRGRSRALSVAAGEIVPVSITAYPLDTDGDGFYNYEDLLPAGNAKIQVVLKGFKVFAEDRDIYFKIWYWDESLESWEMVFRAPEGDLIWPSDVGVVYKINRSGTIDVADNLRYHWISIEMWDSDFWTSDDLYDIDPDKTKRLNLRYDLKTGVWTGNDTDGVTSGPDGYLEYEIRTVVE